MSGPTLVLVEENTDPEVNLAQEDELLDEVEKGSLPESMRFWRNSECIVRGKARSSRYGWYDEELARRAGVRVLVRSTGGGAVYHDLGNLNWSHFFRTQDGCLSPRAAFEASSKPIVDALNKLDVPAHFAPPNRIDVAGGKVSGMAAKSTARAMLVHGTLLVRSDIQKLNALCIPPPDSPPVSNLSRWSRDIDASSVVRAVVDALGSSRIEVRRVFSRREGPSPANQ